MREPHGNRKPNLMRVTRKRDYPEECDNREEDSAKNRNAEKSFVSEKAGVSMVSADQVF